MQLFLVAFAKIFIQMGTKDKLIERFKNLPKDFTFNELKKLLHGLGFEMSNIKVKLPVLALDSRISN